MLVKQRKKYLKLFGRNDWDVMTRGNNKCATTPALSYNYEVVGVELRDAGEAS